MLESIDLHEQKAPWIWASLDDRKMAFGSLVQVVQDFW